MSSQECVYRCLPELWLRRTFPATVFITTELPSNRIRMRKSDKELSEVDDQSTDVFYSNIIERYSDRPNSLINNGAYAVVDNMCLQNLQLIITNHTDAIELLENQVSTTRHRYPRTVKRREKKQ